MKDARVKDADCIRYKNFLLLPQHLRRLMEVVRLREEFDRNRRRSPAFTTQETSPLE